MNTLASYIKHTYSKCRVSSLISLLTQLCNKFTNKVFRYNLTFLGIYRNFIWRGLRKCKREVGLVCKSTCSNAWSQVKLNSPFSDVSLVHLGLHQSSVLSSLLFITVLEVSTSKMRSERQQRGVLCWWFGIK